MHADTRKRRQSMLLQSLKPEGGNYSLDYTKSDPIKKGMTSSPRGYVPGEHMHHTAIVDVYEPIFRNTHPTEAALLADIAASKGVPMGNHPKNFVSMPENDHLSGMHGYAGDIRMQLNNLGAEERAQVDQFLNKVGNASFEAKKEALLTMLEYGQPIMDDRLTSLGYDFKSRPELAREYEQELLANYAQARKDNAVDILRREIESKEHLSKTGKPLRGEKLAEARIDDLLRMEDAQAMKDMYQAELMKEVGAGDLRNYDNLVRQNGGDDRQVTINADTVILEKAINGNGKRRR